MANANPEGFLESDGTVVPGAGALFYLNRLNALGEAFPGAEGEYHDYMSRFISVELPEQETTPPGEGEERPPGGHRPRESLTI